MLFPGNIQKFDDNFGNIYELWYYMPLIFPDQEDFS